MSFEKGLTFPSQGGQNDYNSNTSYSQPTEAEFQRLRGSISSNIFGISSNSTTLEKALQTIGNADDSKTLRLKLQTLQTSSKVAINYTTTDLKRLKAMVESTGEARMEKLVVNRLETDFRSHVERYTAVQKKLVAKMKATPLRAPSPAPETVGVEDDLQLVTNEEKEYQTFEVQTVEFDLEMAVETASRVQQIESDIVDIHEIMTQLGSMVHEQGEAVDTIEENVDNANVAVEAGTQELHRAAKLQTSRRKCILATAVVGTVLLVIIIVVIFFTQKGR
ncbi:unnamed protein product [Allacma fusca]|uniref:t-SNARE coiled-coil homology domain-containing protein n=1 Tax=Allacma fusca TaxID=39272 RepID=A0A8J2K2K8_9HEXA|nr:unnamed protein product [Allacma fusca]